jgi:hypothetical protein
MAVCDHAAPVDDDDVVGEAIGLLHVLRRQEDGRAAAHQFRDRRPHLRAAARVEARGRLVEEYDLGLRDQGRGEVEPAPHPAGVGLRRPVARVDQVERLEELFRPRPRPRFSEMVEAPDHVEVLEPG